MDGLAEPIPAELSAKSIALCPACGALAGFELSLRGGGSATLCMPAWLDTPEPATVPGPGSGFPHPMLLTDKAAKNTLNPENPSTRQVSSDSSSKQLCNIVSPLSRCYR